MAKIVITTVATNTAFVDVVFNTFPYKFKDSRIRKETIKSVDTLQDGKIQLDFVDGDTLELNFTDVDEIDGDTSITSNTILRNKLRTLLIA